MTDKKAINALDPEANPEEGDLLYLRKGAGSNVDRRVELPESSAIRSSVGALADHQDPADKELLARLDHLESALGIDTEGPAGADVLAAVGRGAIVESDTNENGSYVRWENGEQVAFREVDHDFNNAASPDYDFPADFTDRPTGSIAFDVTTDTSRIDAYADTSISTGPTQWRVLVSDTRDEEQPARLFAWGFWK